MMEFNYSKLFPKASSLLLASSPSLTFTCRKNRGENNWQSWEVCGMMGPSKINMHQTRQPREMYGMKTSLAQPQNRRGYVAVQGASSLCLWLYLGWVFVRACLVWPTIQPVLRRHDAHSSCMLHASASSSSKRSGSVWPTFLSYSPAIVASSGSDHFYRPCRCLQG